mmetsp:Transcript_13393/g.11889  ORF Transcript_13393/g.11889 Transcript_13393/m.11889 type:complete len:228 (+) Transcript_13393:792-1475(+)
MDSVYQGIDKENRLNGNKMKMNIDEAQHQIKHESTQIELKESQICIQEDINGLDIELKELNTEIERLELEMNGMNRSLNTKSVEFDHLKQTIISLKRSHWSSNDKLNNSHHSDKNNDHLVYKPKEDYQSMEEVQEEPEDRTPKEDKYPFQHEDLKHSTESRTTIPNTSHLMDPSSNQSYECNMQQRSMLAKIELQNDSNIRSGSLLPLASTNRRTSSECCNSKCIIF